MDELDAACEVLCKRIQAGEVFEFRILVSEGCFALPENLLENLKLFAE